jgi:lysozyme
MRNVTPRGREAIIEHEGLRLRMYRCTAGKPTIGVGHLITDEEKASGLIQIGDRAVRWREGLTREDAADLLDQDLDRFERAVEKLAPGLTDNQFDALVSLVFNIGVAAFKHPDPKRPERPSGVLRAIREGRHADVPAEMAKWNRAGGKVDRGLVRRRAREAALWSA